MEILIIQVKLATASKGVSHRSMINSVTHSSTGSNIKWKNDNFIYRMTG